MNPEFIDWLEQQIYISFGYDKNFNHKYNVGHPNTIYSFYTWEQIAFVKPVYKKMMNIRFYYWLVHQPNMWVGVKSPNKIKTWRKLWT
jgi:hypothetical protein